MHNRIIILMTFKAEMKIALKSNKKKYLKNKSLKKTLNQLKINNKINKICNNKTNKMKLIKIKI